MSFWWTLWGVFMELHRAADMLPSPGPIIYSFIMLSFLPIWIGREKVKATMPLKFQRCCQNVTVMLDCLAIAQETSSSLTLKSQTFSNCRIRMTLKGLMGVSPSGLAFISPLYTVCISDKETTRISGARRPRRGRQRTPYPRPPRWCWR